MSEQAEINNCENCVFHSLSLQEMPCSKCNDDDDLWMGAKDVIALQSALTAAQEENKRLLSALISMCDQYLQEKDGRLFHYFMSAGEEATETLEDLGFLVCEEGENYRWTDKRQSALNGGK
jgi:hypothetical protein